MDKGFNLMAWWDSKSNMTWFYPAEDLKNNWCKIDCGCSGGLEWGGNYPRECNRCEGSGHIYWHKKSKTFAQYPGGSFLGRGELSEEELNGNLEKKKNINND